MGFYDIRDARTDDLIASNVWIEERTDVAIVALGIL